MDKKAQTNILFILMMGIVFFILGLALTPAVTQTADEASHNDLLNCSNSTLTTTEHAICTQTDMFAPLFIGIIFGLAAMLIAAIGTS